MRNTGGLYILSALLAVVFSAACYTSVYSSFVKIRMKILDYRLPADGGSIVLPFRVRPAQRSTLPILTLKAGNDTGENRAIRVLVNSSPLGTLILPPHARKRMNFEIRKGILIKANRMRLEGDGTGWFLEQLELGNAYGFSNRFPKFLLIQKSDSGYDRVPPETIPILFGLLLFLGCFFPERSSQAILNRVHKPFFLLIVLLFAAMSLLPLFSKYRLIISMRSFVFYGLFCYCPALYRLCQILYQKAKTRFPQTRTFAKSSIAILGVSMFFLSSMRSDLQEFQGNYTGFLHLSQKRYKKVPFQRELDQDLALSPTGFDGQFFYLMTFDPFLVRYKSDPQQYENLVDAPPFRYRRIGFSLLTKLFSLGRPEYYPETMIFLILAFLGLGAFFLVKIALLHNQDPLWALLLILIPAFTMSLKMALPEPISAALLLGGLYFYSREKLPLSVTFFALSLLVRETGALVVLLILLIELFGRRNLRAVFLVATSFLPYSLWRLFIGCRLFSAYGWEAFFYEPGNFSFPFFGIAQMFSAIRRGEYLSPLVPAALTLPLLLTIILCMSVILIRKKKDALTFALFSYSLLAVSLNFQKVWRQVGNVERQSFESFLCLLVVYITTATKWPKLKYAFLVLLTLILVYDSFFFTEHDSFRSGLLLKEILRPILIGS